MKTNVVAMILIIAVRQLRQMSVQYNIPQQVIIHSNYLDLGKTVGQGKINIIFITAGYLYNVIPKVNLE